MKTRIFLPIACTIVMAFVLLMQIFVLWPQSKRLIAMQHEKQDYDIGIAFMCGHNAGSFLVLNRVYATSALQHLTPIARPKPPPACIHAAELATKFGFKP